MFRKRHFLTVAALLVSAYAGNVFAQVSSKLPAPGEAPAGSPVAVHGALKVGVAGGKGVIQDKSGTAVTLRGMSLFWANSEDGAGYYNEAVVGWLAHDWNVSVVRAAIGVHKSDGGGNPGYVDGDAVGQLSAARTVIEAAIKRGIYVIVDWHMHELDRQGYNIQSKAVEFFGIIARDYGQYPNVIYEVWNEPINAQWATIKSYSEAVVAEIRKSGDGVVVVGSPTYSQNPNAASGNNKVSDSKNNTAYSIHFYAASHTFRNNMTSAVDNGLAVLATEWGTVNYDGNGSMNKTESINWINAMESAKVGWANWSVTHKKEGASALSANGTSGGPWTLTTTGEFVRDSLVRKNKAAYSNWVKTYSIGTTVSGNGKVEKKVNNAVSNGPYNYGTTVAITAVPDAGWEFSNWEDDAAGSNASLSYKVVGASVNVKAVFVPLSLIKNGYFGVNLTSWTSSNVTITPEDGALKAAVTSAGSASSPSNVRQQAINIEAGKKYELKFKAKTASGTRKITPRVTNSNRDRNYIADTAAVDLTTEWKTYTKEFTMCYQTSSGPVSDASAQVVFQCAGYGAEQWTWYLDEVSLNATGTGPCGPLAALPAAVSERRGGWSVSRAGGALTLRGPAEAGAKASLYDTRGKVVRSMSARDGLSLGAAGIPAGNYFLIVKNRAGAEVYRAKVLMVR